MFRIRFEFDSRMGGDGLLGGKFEVFSRKAACFSVKFDNPASRGDIDVESLNYPRKRLLAMNNSLNKLVSFLGER